MFFDARALTFNCSPHSSPLFVLTRRACELLRPFNQSSRTLVQGEKTEEEARKRKMPKREYSEVLVGSRLDDADEHLGPPQPKLSVTSVGE